MTVTTLATPKGDLALVAELEAPLRSGAELLEVLMNSGCETLVLRASDLTDGFFDLKTGIAGDMLQKISNYQRRLALIGDFSAIESKSLRNFIFESNKRGQVVFANSVEAVIALLK